MFVQQEVAKLAMTAIEYPSMQKGASFNLDVVKARIKEAMQAHHGTVIKVLTWWAPYGRPQLLAMHRGGADPQIKQE